MNENERNTKAAAIRADVLKMIYEAQSGHVGGSMSAVEILMALYYEKAKIYPKDPQNIGRDRIVLSKGHAVPAAYSILSDLGYFPREDLRRFRQVDSHLQGQPDMNKTPGIDVNTGSLGQGASVAVGYALGSRVRKIPFMTYVVLGDGELQEGQVWEAAMSAAHYKLDNLVFILDNNGCQIDGRNDDVMSLGDIIAKFKAFGFETYDIDGHDIDEILNALNEKSCGAPRFIRCRTVKGKGISFMENNPEWHAKAPDSRQLEQAMRELGVDNCGW